MTEIACETLIVGSGITGLTIARELVKRGLDDILIIDKEPEPGRHASGRNSGVLHAGIYYTPDTLKARFCVVGNQRMKNFCRENGLTLVEGGKVIVATEGEIDALVELKSRAEAAGARVEEISPDQLKEIEPHAFTSLRALWSPDTAAIRPREILDALVRELSDSRKVRVLFDSPFVGRGGERRIISGKGTIEFKQMVNAAGAFADRVAHAYGLGLDYRTIPFKGTYRKLRPEKSFLVRGNIYPVPDLGKPFLGVHLSRNASGEVYAGPTAIPAFGRENYRAFDGWSKETLAILARDGLLLWKDKSFRSAAFSETRKYLSRYMFREARKLVPELQLDDLDKTNKVGIRPQLIHWPTKKLVMDFVMLAEDSRLHILNAISPAFTSSMAFAEHAVDVLLGKGESHAVHVREAENS